MSKQRVFKLNYLLRGKRHSKRSSTLLQLQKYDSHMLVSSPSVSLTSWSSRFLVFCHFWFVESAGNTVVSLVWLAEPHIDHLAEYFRAGPFECTFTLQQRRCWNSLPSAGAFWDARFNMITFSHRHKTECCIHTCISPYVSEAFCFFCHYTTGSLRCICIGYISMLLFAEQCILFAL